MSHLIKIYAVCKIQLFSSVVVKELMERICSPFIKFIPPTHLVEGTPYREANT